MHGMPLGTLTDCLNIVQARRAMMKPDFSGRRSNNTDWIQETAIQRCQPPYSWRGFYKTLNREERTNLIKEFGTAHKTYCNDILQVLNDEIQQALPLTVEDQLAQLHADN
jgi:hypothetical protein